MKLLTCFLFVCVAVEAVWVDPGVPLPPTRLRVEYLDSPLSIDTPTPRFSWALAHTGRQQVQSAFRVVVFCQPSGSLQWDSGTVASNRTLNVAYGGPALASDTDFVWRVTWFDARGVASPPSQGNFSTALLGGVSDWLGAAWLSSPGDGALNTYRAEFSLPAPPTRARLYVSGLGYAKTWLNGALTDDHELGSGTVFQRRVLYDCVEVAPLLREGANALGVMLGRGWFAAQTPNSSTDWEGLGPRQFMLLLSVSLADNTTARFVTALGGSGSRGGGAGGPGASQPLHFTATTGPVSDPTLVAGEAYDGRVAEALTGWALPHYTPRAGVVWTPATAPALSPASLGSALSAHTVVARALRDYAPLSLGEPTPGLFSFDFGQNMAGFVTLHLPAPCPAGTLIALQLTETLTHAGVPNNQFCERPIKWLCAVQQRANYTCSGSGSEESYRVTFSSMGFRYAALQGWPPGAPPPTPQALTAHFVHADVEQVGTFTSSSPLLNAIQSATLASVLSNLADYPTDCPSRERRGWMDGSHVMDTVLASVDGGALYSKWVRDFGDAQEVGESEFGAGGGLPDVVPLYGGGQREADPAWGIAAWVVPATLASYYDDERLEADWYPRSRAYMEHWVGLAGQGGGGGAPPPTAPGTGTGVAGGAPPPSSLCPSMGPCSTSWPWMPRLGLQRAWARRGMPPATAAWRRLPGASSSPPTSTPPRAASPTAAPPPRCLAWRRGCWSPAVPPTARPGGGPWPCLARGASTPSALAGGRSPMAWPWGCCSRRGCRAWGCACSCTRMHPPARATGWPRAPPRCGSSGGTAPPPPMRGSTATTTSCLAPRGLSFTRPWRGCAASRAPAPGAPLCWPHPAPPVACGPTSPPPAPPRPHPWAQWPCPGPWGGPGPGHPAPPNTTPSMPRCPPMPLPGCWCPPCAPPPVQWWQRGG